MRHATISHASTRLDIRGSAASCREYAILYKEKKKRKEIHVMRYTCYYVKARKRKKRKRKKRKRQREQHIKDESEAIHMSMRRDAV